MRLVNLRDEVLTCESNANHIGCRRMCCSGETRSGGL